MTTPKGHPMTELDLEGWKAIAQAALENSHEAFKRFIATFDPPTVLALIARIEELEAERSRPSSESGDGAGQEDVPGLADANLADANLADARWMASVLNAALSPPQAVDQGEAVAWRLDEPRTGIGLYDDKADAELDQRRFGGVIKALYAPPFSGVSALKAATFMMSEPHLTGWRLSIGFETLAELHAAEDALREAVK